VTALAKAWVSNVPVIPVLMVIALDIVPPTAVWSVELPA
jgi:hypothetical protein